MVAPINRIHPEILALIPDYWWETPSRDQHIIALTHVCRAWRELFVSRSSLWTNIDCDNVKKAEVYLKRSKSSPVDMALIRSESPLPYDPFFRIIPLDIGRLESIYIEGTRENLEEITAHLTRPAPLLEELFIYGGTHGAPNLNSILSPTLFNKDLSSLCQLSLESVRTELPWRNMANLTRFMLTNTSSVSM